MREEPHVGDVVVSVEWPSGRTEFVAWPDFLARHLWGTTWTFTRWLVRLWWQALRRRVRREQHPRIEVLAERLDSR